MDQRLETDPNQNYERLTNHITVAKQKHLPYRFVKFNKHRHKDKKWITNEIIDQIKRRDNLYQSLKKNQDTTEFRNKKKKPIRM